MSKGLAGVKTLTAKQIADKWKLPLAVVAKKIAAGVKVEKEHTTSTRQANEIARDHLGERPDYYDKLHKMEKTKIVKEDTGVGGVRGLGFVSGDPAAGTDYIAQYINTNSMAYYDENGNKLEYIKKLHNQYHNDKLGFNAFDPTRIGANKNFIKEAKLNELGDYIKDGSPGYEGTTGPIRAVRKRDVKEQSPANPSYKERPMYEKSTGKIPADMSDATARGIYELYPATDERLGRYIKRSAGQRAKALEGPKADVKTWERKHHFIQSAIKKLTSVKEEDTKKDVALMGNQKPDAYGYGAKGTTHTIHEETKMDTKELVNEALDCILEDNLSEMKDTLMLALQEKAMEKLEERKKEIAAQYFAQ